MPEFVPGLELSEAFYRDVVGPILKDEFPSFSHAAALIGFGSEVLGFDTEMSTDHHWGPRVMLFHRLENKKLSEEISRRLADRLPVEFMGYPTNFTDPDPNDAGSRNMLPVTSGPINHRVEFLDLGRFFEHYLDYDIDVQPNLANWLSFPTQRLRSIAYGGIFHDDVGLGEIRSRLAWYPNDVWLYLLACSWRRIAQEEHLIGRVASVGDEVGWRIIAARLVRDVMRLAFLMEREYAPYAKWFGSAFSQLRIAALLQPALTDAIRADSFGDCENALSLAYEILAQAHNALAITARVDPDTRQFHSRAFEVIGGDRFCDALVAEIEDEAIASMRSIGSIDLISDNTDVLGEVALANSWLE